MIETFSPKAGNKSIKMDKQRLRITIQGAVQGVGFRPFIYHLANQFHLYGFVQNSIQGVVIEVEGKSEHLSQFILAIEDDKPAQASIYSLESTFLDMAGYSDFRIIHSKNTGETTAWVLPDIATCDLCLNEIFDPQNRRYLYPFTNCTNCGPRYSIIEKLPYDRQNTTMKAFAMCPECQREYDDPPNRRFHAQPNACPVCGPHLEFWDGKGNILSKDHHAIQRTVNALMDGKIVALKGLGGFQLLVDAANEKAVRRLRQRKIRDEKPFAIMFPDMDSIEAFCIVDAIEKRWLNSPQAPIVLLQRKAEPAPFKNMQIADSVAPENPSLGIMLPYTPLHHILMHELNAPVIATSGNLADEPICITNDEALARLAKIADFFLTHNRPIIRQVDDSVGRVISGREMLLRRARGYAPLPITVKQVLQPTLAVGGHLKNTIAIGSQNQVFISQHIGDLETEQSFLAFQKILADLPKMYQLSPKTIACDKHPDYISTRFAERMAGKPVRVQHHYAHVLSCMAENEIIPPALGVAWDGTGYGMDGKIWGGEFLLIETGGFERKAFLRPFPLPGGEKAIREPRRSGLGILFELGSHESFFKSANDFNPFKKNELENLALLLEKGINSPLTSSAGRLFDAVSSLLNIQQINHFEGQAAMNLEYAAWNAGDESGVYEFKANAVEQDGRTPWMLDWGPMLLQILAEIEHETDVSTIAARFHNTLAEMIVAIAQLAGEERIVLSGGTFQNKYLTEKTIQRLRKENFYPYWHQRVPPNDGGISLGQVIGAANNPI